jgi:hypothetical protein
MTSMPFPSPTIAIDDERQVLLGYLDFFREVAITKVGGLPAAEQSSSRLPSGWTPLELLNHLRHVERRWLEWGFAGQPVPDPWADRHGDRWHADSGFAEVARDLYGQATVTRRVVEGHELDDTGRPGERWEGAPPPALRRVLLHLMQEYARHCGHLDIVRELADGSTGEDPG